MQSLSTLEALRDVFGKNALLLEQVKEAGTPIVGTLCIYTPSELILAAGGLPVSLCGTRQDAIPSAETVLPRTLCPLVKSTYGVLLDDSCPYMSAADFVVADTTCDGKKKMYELLAERKELLLLQLPQRNDPSALTYWREQLQRMREALETRYNRPITDAALLDAIRVCNRERRAIKRIFDTARHNPSPLTGMDIIDIGSRIGFVPDRARAAELLEALAAELEEEVRTNTAPPSTAPRILYTGVPMGMGTQKVIRLLEECGAQVVCIDNCSAYKKTRLIMDEAAAEADPLGALAAQTLGVPCAVMSPNPKRYEALEELTSAFAVDGVVNLTWQGCQTFETEAWPVGRFVKENLGLPYLHLISDYSEQDTEQLKVRLEAFLELVTMRKEQAA